MNNIATKAKLQRVMSKQILASNVLLIIFVFIVYLTNAFDEDEFFATLALLSALTALYFGAFTRFISQKLNNPNKKSPEQVENEPSVGFSSILLWVIPIHVILFVFVILLKALAFINFTTMNQILLFIETAYGASVGHITHTVFDIGKTIE